LRNCGSIRVQAMKLLETFLWALLAFLCAGSMRVVRPTPLSNDSYQYLSAAENVRHDHQLATSLVHFDTERSHGRIPAPLTTFPPGYPVVVAMTSLSSDLEGAARMWSCVCYAGTAALLAWALMLAGVAPLLRQFTLLAFVTNVVALRFATAAVTESMYVLLSTGAVVGLIWAEQEESSKRAIARVVIALSVAGLGYWVRYAGLFLIAALVGYAFFRLLLPGSRFRTEFLLSTLAPAMFTGSLMLRNVIVVGTWKGGNEMSVHHPVSGVLADYARAQLHLVLGQHPVTFGVWEGLLVVGCLGVTTLLIIAVRKAGLPVGGWQWMGDLRRPSAVAMMVGLCVLVWSAGMFYAGLRTVISFGTRMFLPMLPLYLLLLGMGVNWLASRWPAPAQSAWLKIGLLLFTVGYAGVNARDLYDRPSPAPHEILAAEYAKPMGDGSSLLRWVESHIPVGESIVAADGQATGYLLHRRTVSMVGPEFSPVRWECDEVRKQLKRFKANFVILYKPSFTVDPESLLNSSSFVATSVTPQPPSCGFVIAAENPAVRILESAARH
jgi:hypothetical protein